MTEKSKRKNSDNPKMLGWQIRLRWLAVIYGLFLLPSVTYGLEFLLLSVGIIVLGICFIIFCNAMMREVSDWFKNYRILGLFSNIFFGGVALYFGLLCFGLPAGMSFSGGLHELENWGIDLHEFPPFTELTIVYIPLILGGLLGLHILPMRWDEIFKQYREKSKSKNDYQHLADESSTDGISLQHLAENEAEQNKDLR